MDAILRALKATMDTPKTFGGVHFVAMGAAIFLFVIITLFFRNCEQKTYRNILLTIWSVMFAMDVLRMIYMCYSVTPEGEITWSFYWTILPFQLCDAPLYLLPVIACLKDGKLRDALSAFTYSYVLLGGLVTFINISSIATAYVFLNVQTLLHHGLQIVSAAYIAVYNRRNIRIQHFLYGAAVFIACVIFVTGYNVLLNAIHPEQRVNMYFISPYQKKVSPIFNDAWMKITGIWQILFYVGGVTAFAFILFMMLYGLFYLLRRIEERKSPSVVRA